MGIKDKVIILTGAARIGLDVAASLMKLGAKLVVTYRSQQPQLGQSVVYVKADLTNPEDVKRVVDEAKAKFGRIDVLIHMAANYQRVPWDQINDQTMQESMWAILRSAALMSKEVGDVLLKNPEGGKILLFSDWSVLTQPYKDYLPYNVAKSAVVGLMKSLAKELAPKIAVNVIAPGPILKPADLSDEDDAEVMKNTPLQRWGGEHEITKAVIYLLESDFVTGQVLFVDGGRSIA